MARKNSSPGDATGKKRAALAKQHEKEQQERAGQMSMISAEQEAQAAGGVFDPQTGALLEEAAPNFHAEEQRQAVSGNLAPGTRQVGDPGTDLDDEGILYADGQEEFGFQTNNTEILGVGVETPFQVPGGAPGDELVRGTVDRRNAVMQRLGGFAEVEDLGVDMNEQETVNVRVNADITDMTVGAGNNYTFIEGHTYRVPRNVADRLEELDYIWH